MLIKGSVCVCVDGLSSLITSEAFPNRTSFAISDKAQL
jgi:hypothetical protein